MELFISIISILFSPPQNHQKAFFNYKLREFLVGINRKVYIGVIHDV
jgi:hypothetical protein